MASQDAEITDIPLDTDIPLCSIAKREEEIFIPSTKEPILFEHGTPELMVLQKARDESHRFSITANRSARTKAMKKNILEELPGIGPVTRKKLLKLAGSVDGIKDISTEELQSICTKAQMETLRDHGIIS
jgi:excinuclease ABC subunit C